MNETTSKRVFVSDDDFVDACLNLGVAQDVADLLGLAVGTVKARATKLRTAGVVLPEFKRKGRAGPDVSALNAKIAAKVGSADNVG